MTRDLKVDDVVIFCCDRGLAAHGGLGVVLTVRQPEASNVWTVRVRVRKPRHDKHPWIQWFTDADVRLDPAQEFAELVKERL